MKNLSLILIALLTGIIFGLIIAAFLFRLFASSINNTGAQVPIYGTTYTRNPNKQNGFLSFWFCIIATLSLLFLLQQ